MDTVKAESADVKGLYLVPPHGRLIASGQKRAIAKSKECGLTGDWILVSGKKAYGDLRLGEPTEVDIRAFDMLRVEHYVSVKERSRWWPKCDTLWLYPVLKFESYAEPLSVHVPAGVQTVMQSVEMVGEKRWVTLKDGRHVRVGAATRKGGTAIGAVEKRTLAHMRSSESAYLFDQDGNRVFKKTGEADYIEYTDAEIAQMRDAILTHNHPVTGGSFSNSDVRLAMRGNLAEVRAVGRGPQDETYVYRLTRPDAGWGKVATYTGEAGKAGDRVSDRLWADVRAGKLSPTRAEFNHNHEVMRLVADAMGWDYARSKVD